jgi:PAS domain S-box-containing protein
MRDGLIITDAHGVIVFWNPAAQRILGYSVEEAMGKSVDGLVVSPHSREILQAMRDLGVAGRGAAVGKTLELAGIRKDGVEIPVELSLSGLQVEGEWLGVGVVRDVTHRKQEKQALYDASLYARNLIEASLDSLVTFGPDGKIADANEATLNLVGVSREVFIGSDPFIYVTDPESARAGLQEAYEKGFLIDLPLTVRHASGKETDLLYSARVLRNQKGESVGVVATGRDITERKQMERMQTFQASVMSAILQASPDGILLVDPEEHIVSRNQRFLDMWAVPPDIAASTIDTPLLEFVASQVTDRTSFIARVNEIYAPARRAMRRSF